MTVGYSMVGTPPAERRWVDVPDDLAERLSEATFRRTLRVIIDGYRTPGISTRSTR